MFFESVVGHQNKKEALLKLLKKKTVPHALIFTGLRGIGKKFVAKEYAKLLMTPKYDPNHLSFEVHSNKIDQDIHPDLMVIEPNDKNNILISQVRQLIREASYKPTEGENRVVIVNGAECMNREAQNALLKTLEEPPKRLFFILIASDIDLVLPTVLSRCQRISFDPLTKAELREILVQDPEISEKQAEKIVSLTKGSLERLEDYLAINLVELENYLFDQLKMAKTGEVTGYAEWGKTPRDEALFQVDMLCDIFRDVLMMKTMQGFEDSIFYRHRVHDLKKVANDFDIDEVQSILEALGQARQQIQQSLSLKLIYMKIWNAIGVQYVN